jgi:hypothetical protein
MVVPSDASLLFDVTVGPAMPTVDDLSDPQPGFWDYNLTILEGYGSGGLQANAQFDARGVSTYFYFDQTEGSFVWAKVNDKYLQIFYDYQNHCKSNPYVFGSQISAKNRKGPILRTIASTGA